jgi:uncharacterized protein (DUF2062 family)
LCHEFLVAVLLVLATEPIALSIVWTIIIEINEIILFQSEEQHQEDRVDHDTDDIEQRSHKHFAGMFLLQRTVCE